MTLLPASKYSIVFEGKEYFVYSPSLVRGFTRIVALCCISKAVSLSTSPKNLIRESILAASFIASFESPEPQIHNSTSLSFTILNASTRFMIPNILRRVPVYRTTFLSVVGSTSLLPMVPTSTIPSITMCFKSFW